MISAEGPPDSRLDAAPRPAAVLLLLYPDPTGGADTIVFTRRPEEMRHHPGQISLPGGSREPEDADAVATALREAQEELAIPPSAVQVIATLEPVFTVVSNYLITPVVGRAAARPAFVADPREVAEVIEVPLAVAVPCDAAVPMATEVAAPPVMFSVIGLLVLP